MIPFYLLTDCIFQYWIKDNLSNTYIHVIFSGDENKTQRGGEVEEERNESEGGPNLSREGRSGTILVGLVGLLSCQILIGNMQSQQFIHEHSKWEDINLLSVNL